MNRKCVVAVCVLLWAGTVGHAAEPFRYPEAKHGKGELKYVNGVPVLLLAGTPEEIGEQMGVLGLKPAAGAISVFKDLLKREKLDVLFPLLVRFAQTQLAKYPDAYRREFEAVVKASGIDRDLLLVGNCFNELRHLAGCSGLMIAPARSKTGGALMGRNWDFPPLPGMHAYFLVIVHRPEGKRPFAALTFPGAVAAGCLASAMNAEGLALGGNEIRRSADAAPGVDWKNAPTGVIARRVMEECGTLDEAEKLIRAGKPAERCAFVTCDRTGGAVFEITPKNIVMRRNGDGVCIGTNHFLSRELGVPTPCPRLQVLKQAERMEKLGVADVARKMHEANQGAWTAHTLVFEARSLKLHVAFGDGKRSATTFPLKEIDLGPLFKR
jgi:isopenicillin-N N-acyltransferase like protein